MGSIGDCYDNAMCESFFATLECELLDRSRFIDRDQAELAVFDFIEGFYNPQRRHSALGYRAPATFERQMKSAPAHASERLSPPPRSSPSRGRKKGSHHALATPLSHALTPQLPLHPRRQR
jgi:putative transposase